MRCDDYEVLISTAADGELDPASLADLTAHLESCGSCRREYEATVALQQGLATVLGQCGDVPSLTDRVMAQVAPRRRPALRWMWSAAAACAVVLALLAILLWPVRHESKQPRPTGLAKQSQERAHATSNLKVAQKPRESQERASVNRPHKTKPRPRPGPSTVATVRNHAPAPDQQAEVTVEYSDEDAPPTPAATNRQAGLPLPAQMWQGGKMVASCMTVIENGRPVERPTYRLIPDSSHSEGEL